MSITANIPFNIELSKMQTRYNSCWDISCDANINVRMNRETLIYIVSLGMLNQIKEAFKDYVKENYKGYIENIVNEQMIDDVLNKPAELRYGIYATYGFQESDRLWLSLKFFQNQFTLEELLDKIDNLIVKTE